jgi:hypothetical protein
MNVPSLPTIRDEIGHETIRTVRMMEGLGKRRYAPAHLVNTILCWYLAQPETMRNEIVRAGIGEYQRRLDAAGSDDGSESAPEIVPTHEVVDVKLKGARGNYGGKAQKPGRTHGASVATDGPAIVR